MKNNLQVIHEQEVLGKSFKVYGTEKEPMFVAKDVAEWIEHVNPTEMIRKVDEEEKLISTLLRSGQKRQANFLTEYGLYEVLMQSRKPVAKQFKKQVKHILKSIRQDGGYIHTTEQDDEQTILARALILADKTIKRTQAQLEEATKTIEEQAPKVEVYDKYLETDGSMTVTNVLTAIKEQGYKPEVDMRGYRSVALRSASQLNDFLKDNKVQYKRGHASYWTLTVEYNWLIEAGFAVVRQVAQATKNIPQLRWTPEGVDFIIDLLIERGEIALAEYREAV